MTAVVPFRYFLGGWCGFYVVSSHDVCQFPEHADVKCQP